MGCGGSGNIIQGTPGRHRSRDSVTRDTGRKGSVLEGCTEDYSDIDQYVRQAGESVTRDGTEGLVDYISPQSNDHKTLVRGFYVWICENIRYDLEGHGRETEVDPNDPETVMRTGRATSEGFANLMENLCRQAGIPVETIYGYAKGLGHTADVKITPHLDRNHVWNAVHVNGGWCLLDCCWGAGRVTTSRQYNTAFNDHFFLTDPRQFITDHFPYSADKPDRNQSWQLLDAPLTLDEFSRQLKLEHAAFKLGIQPVSHADGLIHVEDELVLTFCLNKTVNVVLSQELWFRDGYMSIRKPRSTQGHWKHGLYTLRVRPPNDGTYDLKVFGNTSSEMAEVNELTYLFQYVIKCNRKTKERLELIETTQEAFDMGIIPVSHINGLVVMKDHEEFIFQCSGQDVLDLSANLVPLASNTLQSLSVDSVDGGLYKLLVQPDIVGTYHLNICGKRQSDTGPYCLLLQYVIKYIDK